MANVFGDIPSSLTFTSGQSLRWNGSAFEAFSPSSGITIGDAIGGSPVANGVLYANGSGNLANSANLTFDLTTLKIGNNQTGNHTILKFDHTAGYGSPTERRIDWESGGTVYSRIANYYDSSVEAGVGGLVFYTGADMTNYAIRIRASKQVDFGGNVTLSNGLVVSKSNDVLEVATTGAAGSKTGQIHNWVNGASAANDEYKIDFKAGGVTHLRQSYYYDGSVVGMAFYTNANLTTPLLKLGSNWIRQSFDASNYFNTDISSVGAVTFDAVGSGAKFTFADDVELNSGKTLKVGGTQFRGYTTSASAVSTTELPNDKDWCFHYDSGAVERWFAVNLGGTVYGVQLTAV